MSVRVLRITLQGLEVALKILKHVAMLLRAGKNARSIDDTIAIGMS
jgi:hypothetical protein